MNKKTAFLKTLYILFLIAFIFTGTDRLTAEVDQFVLEAGGITVKDIEAASKKNEFSLFDAYTLSVKNTEQLPIAREDLRQAYSRKHQAIGAVLPRLSVRGSGILPVEGFGLPETKASSVSLIMKQPLITGLGELSGFEASCREIKMKEYMLSYSASLLLNDVAFGFYQIVQLEKSIKNNERNLELYKKIVNELNRRVAVGKSRKSDVLRISQQLYAVEAAVKSLKSELGRKRLEFTALTGLRADSILSDGGDISAPSISLAEIKNLIENRSEVMASREELKRADALLRGTAAGQFPTAFLEGSYRIYQESPQTENEFYGALGFELPIFSGDVPGRTEELWSIKRTAELKLSRDIKTAEKEIRDSYQTWESSREEIESYRSALLSAEDNSRVILNEYRMNLATILDVLTALTSLQDARDSFDRIILQHRINRIKLGVATGEFSGDGMDLLRKGSVMKSSAEQEEFKKIEPAATPGPGGLE